MKLFKCFLLLPMLLALIASALPAQSVLTLAGHDGYTGQTVSLTGLETSDGAGGLTMTAVVSVNGGHGVAVTAAAQFHRTPFGDFHAYVLDWKTKDSEGRTLNHSMIVWVGHPVSGTHGSYVGPRDWITGDPIGVNLF